MYLQSWISAWFPEMTRQQSSNLCEPNLILPTKNSLQLCITKDLLLIWRILQKSSSVMHCKDRQHWKDKIYYPTSMCAFGLQLELTTKQLPVTFDSNRVQINFAFNRMWRKSSYMFVGLFNWRWKLVWVSQLKSKLTL